LPARNRGAKERNNVQKATQLRSILVLSLAAIATLILVSARPLAAETNAFTLTTQVDPPGSGTVNVNPGPPYSQNQTVTLTATANPGFIFDRWILNDDTGWWDAGWDYRVEVTAAAAGYARKNKPAEFNLNFTQLWTSLGKTGTLDPNSIRVVEVDGNGDVLDDAVPFQFDRATDYNAASKAAGVLVVMMEGNTAAGATRRYHVYFDVTGKGFAAPTVTPQVVLTDGITDEGQASFKIETQTGTLFYHKQGAGFSSYNDQNGNDWITYRSSVTGAGGTFRGIPNSVSPSNGGYFHPGNKGMTTTLRNQGPLKVTIHAIEKKAPGRPKWEGLFEIYPDYATFTMLTAPYNYWVLYEGTPGGALEQNSDFLVRSDGTQTTANQSWEVDLAPEEWVFVGDPALGRSIFFANQIDDNKTDSYAPSENVMTKFGFGRTGASPQLEKDLVPRRFTFGLMNETLYDNAKTIIYNAYRDLTVNVGAAEARAGASLGTQNPVQFTITGEHTIIAQFKPAEYTVAVGVSPAESGTVTKTPNKATYTHGEQVTLAAAPLLAGYNFVEWQGDVTGSTNPVTVAVTKNMNVTAVFAQAFTVSTSANPPEGGSVILNPPGPTYAPGTQVEVTAAVNNGYTFTGWSGGLSGTENPKTITVNGNLNIVANFGQAQYTFSATSAGNGAVDWTPKKDFYASGEQVTVTATADTGYAFNGWTGDVTSNVNPLTIPIFGNTALVANFVATQTYTVVVSVPGGGGTVTANPPGPNYPAGSTVTLTAVPDTGKRFVGWAGDTSGSENPKTMTVNGNLNITAAFEDDGHPLNVTVDPPQGGTVSKQPNQTFYPVGTVVTLTATANTGWTFTGWSGDATGTNPTTTVTIEEGGSDVTASFTAPGPFTLTIGPNHGNGAGTVTVDPQKAQYQFGETVTLTAEPADGSVFTGWSGSATGTKNPLTVTMDGNKSIAATFVVVSGNPQSDNFNMCGLDPRWDEVDPLGDGSFAVNGRELRITVPEGSTHNVWSDANNAPRVMQDADNVDFEYVVKFDSAVTQNAQMQGLVIEESAGRFARFDFEYNNNTVKAYAATIYDGTARKRISIDIDPAAAVYLRVVRGGNKWIMSYSGNGVDWIDAGQFNNFVLNVTKVGVFAGNVAVSGQPAPAHTAIVDFFQNAAEGPMPEDTPLLAVNIVGGGTVTANPPADQVTCGQTVTLTAAPGLGFTFGSWSGDVTGSQPTASLLVNGPKQVTATFVGSTTRYLLLPMITR